jgi:tRNA (guanine-N1)-methyltransferase
MIFDIVTIFPGMVAPILREGILARAVERRVIDVGLFDLRDFTTSSTTPRSAAGRAWC